MLPGIEPGSQEMLHNIKILSDNHYTIAPHAQGSGTIFINKETKCELQIVREVETRIDAT